MPAPAPSPLSTPGSSGMPRWPLVAGIAVLLVVGVLVAWLLVAGGEKTPASSPETRLPVSVLGREVAVVEARPWAEVLRVLDTDGRELELPAGAHTPLRLDLAPGTYTVELQHPARLSEDPVLCTLEVRKGESAECEAQMIELDGLTYLESAGWRQ